MDVLTDPVIMTGGVVAHNPYLIEMVRDITGREILVPESPQLTGAVGAALFALEDRG
jgi:activator of 2-hydroxyglutaryl-CoA dehydratase